jgi:alkylation response protein AidB-like acyl-CoA dehydrogenase
MAGLDRKELNQALNALSKYAEKRLTNDYLLHLDHNDEFPQDVLDELYQDIGLHLLFIPEELGGMGGGAYDIYRVSEVMAGIDLGIATGVLATFLGSDPITVGGTPEQKSAGWAASPKRRCWWPMAPPSRRPAATWPA